MGTITHKAIQATERLTLPVLVREINSAARLISNTITKNYRESYPQVDAVVLADGTASIWLPLEGYEIESIALKVSSGTASVTPRINTSAMSMTTPITATTTATITLGSSSDVVAALDDVDLVVSGLTGVLVAALKVRRLG